MYLKMRAFSFVIGLSCCFDWLSKVRLIYESFCQNSMHKRLISKQKQSEKIFSFSFHGLYLLLLLCILLGCAERVDFKGNNAMLECHMSYETG